MNKLHPGVKWIFRLRSYPALMPLIFFIIIPLIGISSLFDSKSLFFLISIIFSILSIIIISEIYTKMSYNRWLYEITQEGIKIEKGIIWKKYTSIPFERVQNVDIQRGILARMFGFSTLEIETAGQSGLGGSYHGIRFGNRRNQRYMSEGHLPGVDSKHAEEIRDFILDKIKKSHSKKNKQGL